MKTWRHNTVDYVAGEKATGHILNETSSPAPPPLSSAHRADNYSWPIEVSAFAAHLMIARLLSPAPSHPAVRLRKPAYQTAPDIVVVVVGGGWFWGMGRGSMWGKVWIEEKETERERNPRGKCWHQQPSHSWSSPVARITAEGYNRVWNCFCESLTFKTL